MRQPQTANSRHTPTGAPARAADGLRRLVIIPVFNERGAVTRLLTRLRRTLPEFDLLVIDDGSTDDTLRCIPSGVTVVSLPFNLGIGGAMQTGYKYAALHGYDLAVQVDGDGQHRPSEVRRLVRTLLTEDADLVVGSRFMEQGQYRQTLARRTGAWILGGLLRMMTGQAVTDCTSGFRAANRRVIRAFAHWYPEDYPEPEVILLLHRAGYRILELPVRMRQRREGRSSIGIISGLYYVMKVTACLLLDQVRAPWPLGKVSEACPVAVVGSRPDAHRQERDPAGAWRQPVHAGGPTPPSVPT